MFLLMFMYVAHLFLLIVIFPHIKIVIGGLGSVWNLDFPSVMRTRTYHVPGLGNINSRLIIEPLSTLMRQIHVVVNLCVCVCVYDSDFSSSVQAQRENLI